MNSLFQKYLVKPIETFAGSHVCWEFKYIDPVQTGLLWGRYVIWQPGASSVLLWAVWACHGSPAPKSHFLLMEGPRGRRWWLKCWVSAVSVEDTDEVPSSYGRHLGEWTGGWRLCISLPLALFLSLTFSLPVFLWVFVCVCLFVSQKAIWKKKEKKNRNTATHGIVAAHAFINANVNVFPTGSASNFSFFRWMRSLLIPTCRSVRIGGGGKEGSVPGWVSVQNPGRCPGYPTPSWLWA